MKILTASIKTKPRQVTTRYGDRIVLDVAFSDGLEETIWNPGHHEWLLELSQGDPVQLAVDSKGKSHLVEPDQDVEMPPTPSTSAQTDKADRERIESYIAGLGRMYGYCWKEAANALAGQAQTEESVRACASSLFIATTRKFSL